MFIVVLVIITFFSAFLAAPRVSDTLALAGHWHGGRMASVATFGSGVLTYKHTLVDEGWLESVAWNASGSGAFAADLDGDARDDAVIYGEQALFIRYANGTTTQQPKLPERLAFGTDFDGNGKAELGTYDPVTRTLYYPDGQVETRANLPMNVIPLAGRWQGFGASVIFFDSNTGYLYFPDGTTALRSTGQPLAADFDGDTYTDFGVFRDGKIYVWSLEAPIPTTITYHYGNLGDLPASGRWIVGSTSVPGVYRPANRTVYLYPNQALDASTVPGTVSDMIAGDWWGEGFERPGLVVSPNHFYLARANGSWQHYTCGTEGGLPFAGKFSEVSGYGIYNPQNAHVNVCRFPGAMYYYFFYGLENNTWLPLAGDWNGDGMTGFGLYDPVMSRFHLSDTTAPPIENATFVFGKAQQQKPLTGMMIAGHDDMGVYDPARALFTYQKRSLPTFNERIVTFAPSRPNYQASQLREFGYYNVDGREWYNSTPQTYLTAVNQLANSTVVHCYPRLDKNPVADQNLIDFLQQAQTARLRVIVNVMNIFRVPGNPQLGEFPDWQERLDYYGKLFKPYRDVIEAFYFDEPLESGITEAQMRAYTSTLRNRFPTQQVMVIESSSQIENGRLTSTYVEFVTDLGIDWYYTDSLYHANRLMFREAYKEFAMRFSKKRHWMIIDGYFRYRPAGSATASDLIDALDLGYALAKNDPQAIGLLGFTFPSYLIDWQIGLDQLIVSGNPYYSPNLRDLHVHIGQMIRTAGN